MTARDATCHSAGCAGPSDPFKRNALRMALTYFKRFRMEISLQGRQLPAPDPPEGYSLRVWDSALLDVHADTKYQSFRTEIDANVFPCLGDSEGCRRLMQEISRKEGFLPGATWLALYQWRASQPPEPCGTIQGIRDRTGFGAVQNLGIVPEHRGRGLGTSLMLAALTGFQRAGLDRAFLEVTAQNLGAIRLYQRLGFSKARTVYKAVEVALS